MEKEMTTPGGLHFDFGLGFRSLDYLPSPGSHRSGEQPARILLEGARWVQHIQGVRAHGMWTYEPRQGRKAATVVCSTSAVVTLALFNDEVRMKNAETAAVQPYKILVSSFFILHSTFT